MRCRQSHRATAHNRNFEGKLRLLASPVHVDWMFGLRAIALGEKPLQPANGDGFVDFSATTGSLARVCANASTDGSQRIRLAREAIGLLEVPFTNQFYIPSGIGMSGTSHHAREVGVQPVPIHSLVFESLQHACLSRRASFKSIHSNATISARKNGGNGRGGRTAVPSQLLTYSG